MVKRYADLTRNRKKQKIKSFCDNILGLIDEVRITRIEIVDYLFIILFMHKQGG